MKSIYSIRRVERESSATSLDFVQLLQGCESDPTTEDTFCAYGIGLEYFNLSTHKSSCFELIQSSDEALAPPILALRFIPNRDLTVAFFTWQTEKVLFAKIDTEVDAGGGCDVFVLNDESTGPSRPLGSIQCVGVGEDLVFWGTEKGALCVYAHDWQHDLYNSVGFVGQCHQKLESQKAITDGVLQVCCVNHDGNELCLVSGGADGNLSSWRLQLSPQREAENEIILLETYRMDAVPVSALVKATIVESKQTLLVSGSEEGLVTVWNVEAKNGSLTKLASLTRCSNPVHCLSLASGLGTSNESATQGYLRLIVGDDEGGLYVFKPRSSLSITEPILREAWEISTEISSLSSSPVAAVIVHSSRLMVGLCQGGIKDVEYPAARVEDLQVNVQPPADLFASLDKPDTVEEDYEDDPPEPRQPLEPLRFDDMPIPRRVAPVKTEVEDPPPPPPPLSSPPRPPGLLRRAKEDEEVEDLLEVDTEKCFNGYVATSMPPLPLSKFHEPCLNSSNQIKLALERVKLEKFDRSRAIASLRKSSKHKVIAEAVKELDHKKEDELLFANLISVKDTPLKDKYATQKRKVPKQLPPNWSHEPGFTKDKDEVGEDNASGGGEAEEDGSLSESSGDGAKVSPSAKKEEPWFRKKRQSFPWAKEEFYLSNLEDGSVGFRNFHSLQD